MPAQYNPPLPPVPQDDEPLDEFILAHRPEEIVQLIIEIEENGLSDDELTELVQALGVVAHDHVDYAMACAELLLAHGNAEVHGNIPNMAHALLGRGIERFEEIMWDILLHSSEAGTFDFTYSTLSEIVENRYDREPQLHAGRYFDVYGHRAHFLHLLKLGRSRARYEAMRTPRPATSE